jgi:predicted CopG family antitoxin
MAKQIEVCEEVYAELGRRRKGVEPLSDTIMREIRKDERKAERRDILKGALHG